MIISLFPQLKGSELEITLVRGGVCQSVGPACAYVNLKVCVNGTEQGRNEYPQLDLSGLA